MKTAIPQSYSEIGFSAYFVNNFNVMLLVMVCELVFSLLLYLIAKIIRSSKLMRISLRLLKQVFIFLVIFNTFNVAYSGGVQARFAEMNSSMSSLVSKLALIFTLVVIFIALLAIQNSCEKDYGEFKGKFKKDFICRAYIPLSIIYRLSLGLFSSMQSDRSETTLLLLALPIIFSVFNMVNLPFIDSYQNYRSHLIHFTHFLILFVATFYRSMKQWVPL